MDTQTGTTAGLTALLILVAGGLWKWCQSKPTLRSNCCGKQVSVAVSADRSPPQGAVAPRVSVGSSFLPDATTPEPAGRAAGRVAGHEKRDREESKSDICRAV
jgi:hypothetical protein